MDDWCKTCKYIDIDGADLPCEDCIMARSMPTEYTPKRQAVRELQRILPG